MIAVIRFTKGEEISPAGVFPKQEWIPPMAGVPGTGAQATNGGA